VEGLCHLGKSRNPLAVEINETDELMDTPHHRGSLPLYNVRDLFIIHFKAFTTNINSEEFYLFPVEFAFLRITEEICILQTLESISDASDMFGFSLVVVEHIVQVVL
jgi:hypothetical protein